MQTDMHYYGTYALARAAGITRENARVIATAAQFVDDNATKESLRFQDGARLDSEATAHHATDRKNIDLEDQRKIWVPFHFLPGNEGSTYTERLICRKNSRIAQEMVKFNLSLSGQPYALPLMGITAHVYADTFSHYGFSGVSSRKNKLINDSIHLHDLEPEIEAYVRDKERHFRNTYEPECGFLENVKSWFAESLSGALGHGAAVTFPDRPYLKWQFTYEDPENPSGLRDNPATFLEGCNALFDMFCDFARRRPDLAEENGLGFSDIRDAIEGILSFQGPKNDRIQAWKNAAENGELFAGGPESIADYDEDVWHNERENLSESEDSGESLNRPIYRFYQAAAVHRTHVLRNLLPHHKLIVT
jgi:hypothetical protein